MSNKHFSLLVKTLELEERLAGSKLINFSLDNIEKDNKNKTWTFNFSGETLPLADELTLLIQKLRESFMGDYVVNYRLKTNKRILEIYNTREFFGNISSFIREYFI